MFFFSFGLCLCVGCDTANALALVSILLLFSSFYVCVFYGVKGYEGVPIKNQKII